MENEPGVENWFPILIGLAVFFFLYIKPLWDQYKNSQKARRGEEPNALQDFLQKVKAEMKKSEEEDRPLPPPIPAPMQHKQQKQPKKQFTKPVVKNRVADFPKYEEATLPPVDPFMRKPLEGLGEFTYQNGKVADAYLHQKRVKTSNAKRMLNRLPSRNEMLLFQTILGPPKSFE